MDSDLKYISSKEWWLANGAGGWASSTIANANTTKYHGIFVSSDDEGKRYALVSTLEEFVILPIKKYPLSTHFYKDAIYPQGYKYLKDFSFNSIVARWTYEIENNKISKEIWTGIESNQTYLRYTLLDGKGVGLSIIPIFAFREIHSIGSKKISEKNFFYNPRIVKFYFPFEWTISTNRGMITKYQYDYYNFFYQKEFEREEEAIEDLYTLVQINAYLTEGQSLEICFYKEPSAYIDTQLKEYATIQRVKKIYPKEILPNFYSLLYTSEQFLIRHNKKYGVCAGYPYFWQWARDTFISLPGLCLPLKKYKIFLETMENWLDYSLDGVLPNRIEKEPIYESVDGFLWLIWAAREFEKEKKLPQKIKNKIIKEFRYWLEPNEYFKLDQDGLIYLKKPRLTWMDTSIDGVALNPRIGKPIEINSLWLYSLEYLIKIDKKNSAEYKKIYKLASNSIKKFILEENLADNIEPNDPSNRPNQLWAFALLPKIFYNYREMMKNIRKKLFVSGYGFYSLDPMDKNFVPLYFGNIKKRDKAYHNGAIWPYFIGAYTDAWLNLGLDLKTIQQDVEEIIKNINAKALLALPEIYRQQDLAADGCQLQAWSVAETIRSYLKILKANKNKHLLELKLEKNNT
ncbi:MAG: amylo-alpha-1,6-glucosidase [Candidatus Anstonellaceae archaeon]